ncbi:hypothetical protein ACN2WE_31225 [Streptomyces sp. cg28]|uniref:hypothetical protein n=1 Tax=Streptomyces sp. cg28 TaxID=3403457 RepID=UPI003B214E47
MKRPLPDTDTVKTAIDIVLKEAAARGRHPTVTAVERHLGIPHATFHRHYRDVIDQHFRPHLHARAQPHGNTIGTTNTSTNNLLRLRQENRDLRRTLALYEEAIRQLTLENEALRQGTTVVPLTRPAADT